MISPVLEFPSVGCDLFAVLLAGGSARVASSSGTHLGSVGPREAQGCPGAGAVHRRLPAVRRLDREPDPVGHRGARPADLAPPGRDPARALPAPDPPGAVRPPAGGDAARRQPGQRPGQRPGGPGDARHLLQLPPLPGGHQPPGGAPARRPGVPGGPRPGAGRGRPLPGRGRGAGGGLPGRGTAGRTRPGHDRPDRHRPGAEDPPGTARDRADQVRALCAPGGGADPGSAPGVRLHLGADAPARGAARVHAAAGARRAGPPHLRAPGRVRSAGGVLQPDGRVAPGPGPPDAAGGADGGGRPAGGRAGP